MNQKIVTQREVSERVLICRLKLQYVFFYLSDFVFDFEILFLSFFFPSLGKLGLYFQKGQITN